MTEQEWWQHFRGLVRASEQSGTRKLYYSIKLTRPRAQLELAQNALFIRHRRECWSYVYANCTELPVKQALLEHEHEELIRDEYSDRGHLDLVVRQGRAIGLSSEELLNAVPLPLMRAVLYAWSWLTKERPWQEGLAALLICEMCSNNRLLEDMGGGNTLRKAKKWMEDLGLSWEEIPNLAAHSKADDKHSEMFVSYLAEYVPPHQEARVLQAARESLELREIKARAICEAMEKLPLSPPRPVRTMLEKIKRLKADQEKINEGAGHRISATDRSTKKAESRKVLSKEKK
jgi:pyrroloquinoline quinone (PQQ) biosynthesis protein C